MHRNLALKCVFLCCVLAVSFLQYAQALNTIYMENLCGREGSYNVRLNVMTSGILKSIRRDNWNREMDCQVVFLPQNGDSVVLSFYRYSLAPGDELTITDHEDHQVMLHGNGNFQDERKTFTSEGLMTLRYKSNSSSHLTYEDGFQLTFTQTKEMPCLPNYFECDNTRCIEASLACDGHNHCGDNSDQRNCVPKTKLKSQSQQQATTVKENIAAAISAVASSIVIVALIVILIVYAVRRRKENAKNKATASNVNPTNQAGTSAIAATSSGHETTFLGTKGHSLQTSAAPMGIPESIGNHSVVDVPALYPNLAPGTGQPPTAPDFDEGLGSAASKE